MQILSKIDKNITIVAATKGQTADTVNKLPDMGVVLAGENRVQELLEKFPKVDKSISWHMIGQLQTNKVKYIIDKVSLIQSVDRLNLANEINNQAGKINKIMPVLIEINLNGQQNKGGVSPIELNELLDEIYLMKNIEIQGFMTVMPKLAEAALYKQMYSIYSNLQRQDNNFKYLSMGMSDDYLIALDNGSNMLRLGRAIFGK